MFKSRFQIAGEALAIAALSASAELRTRKRVVVKDCFAFHIPDAVHSLRLSTEGDAVIDRKRVACSRAAARP
jgi:hypothetical protein